MKRPLDGDGIVLMPLRRAPSNKLTSLGKNYMAIEDTRIRSRVAKPMTTSGVKSLKEDLAKRVGEASEKQQESVGQSGSDSASFGNFTREKASRGENSR